jgi:hypothetical protein
MFKWAFGDKANLKEPLEALKEQGWQYGDAPTASNFNWLFNKISNELADKAQTNDVDEELADLKRDLKKLDDKILPIIRAMQTIIMVLNLVKDTGLDSHYPFLQKHPLKNNDINEN